MTDPQEAGPYRGLRGTIDVEHQGYHSFAVTMGFDAMRICIGHQPKNHSFDDIVRWLTIMNDRAVLAQDAAGEQS